MTTAPDHDPFRIVVEDVLGEPMEVFAHRHRSVRELLASTERFGDTEYLVFPETRLTYAQHLEQVAALAEGLSRTHGIGKGDRVAILAENRVEWLLSFWAVACLGGVVVGLNGWWAGPELEYALDHSRPSLLLVDERGRRKLDPDLQRPYPCADIVGEVAALVAAHRGAALPQVPIDEDDPLVIMYTSGTTGRAKGAVLSHRSTVGMVQLQTMATEKRRLAEGPLPRDIGCTTFPFFHVSGLYGSVVAATVGGDTMVFVTGRFDAGRVLDTIEREKCTRLSVVPTTAWRIVDHPSVPGRDLTSVRRIAGGAAPTGPVLQRRLREVFPNAVLGFGYGQTENAAIVTVAGDADLLADPDTTGRLVPTVQLEIRDPAGDPVPDGVLGEIYTRSPLIMSGYWRDPEATAAAIGPGRWLRTGDLGHLENGHLKLSARRSDLILRGGENVYPAEIEVCLDGHPDVVESAVLGVPDEEWGQAVRAVVVVRDGAELAEEDLAQWVGERIARFKVPSQWELVHQPLPRNATGKLVKSALTVPRQRSDR